MWHIIILLNIHLFSALRIPFFLPPSITTLKPHIWLVGNRMYTRSSSSRWGESVGSSRLRWVSGFEGEDAGLTSSSRPRFPVPASAPLRHFSPAQAPPRRSADKAVSDSVSNRAYSVPDSDAVFRSTSQPGECRRRPSYSTVGCQEMHVSISVGLMLRAAKSVTEHQLSTSS
jgi:hypothetical protein